MSKAASEKTLNRLLKTVNHAYATRQIDKQKQLVTITVDSLAQSFMEGYIKVLSHRPDLPDGLGWNWKEPAELAMQEAFEHANKPRTKTFVREYIPKQKLVIASATNVSDLYKKIKDTGVNYVQDQLKARGNAPLTDAPAEWERQGREGEIKDYEGKSNISSFKRGIERHHKGATTVGSARLALSMKWLSKTKYFADFTKSIEAKSLEDKYGDIRAVYKTVGSGKRIRLKLEENKEIAIEVAPTSENYSKSEDTDWGHIQPELTKVMYKWAQEQDWWNMPGSKTLKEDFTDATLHAVMTNLTNGKTVISVPKTKPVTRKKSEAKKSTGRSSLIHVGSTKQAKTVRRRQAKKGVASQPLALVAQINQKLPETVAKNMGEPALVYRSGRFAESTKITDVAITAQGFPSLGYTYMRYPYEVFEPGSGSPLSSPQRDPRRIINESIREIATELAIGRFYTRRV